MKFSYYLPTRLKFGFGTLASFGAEVNLLKCSKPLIVTDKVMVKVGVVQKVTDLLGGFSSEVFDEVEPEPAIEVAERVAERVRRGRFDLVVGLGGGSSIDMAKFAAAAASNEGAAGSFVGNDRFAKPSIPSIMIPTTAGTGAEITVTSMVTVEGHKRWINSPYLLPTVALVDPELTMSMPPGVTAATGMDALCHNAEALLSTLASPITDSLALEGVRLVVSNLGTAFEDGGNRKAREGMSLGALLGGMALQARMVYGHSIGYTIATRFRLAHGVSCGLPLPYVVTNYAVACAPKMRALADAFGVPTGSDDPAALARQVGERVLDLLRRLKLPTTLKELGVKEEELEGLANECLAMYNRPNSPLVLDARSMLELYRAMWEGELVPQGRAQRE